MMQFNTPLRYPGGKGRLAQFMGKVIEQNGLVDGHYVEPYAGGAGISLPLLYLEYVQVVHLNDVSRPIHAFWKAVVEHTEEMCRLIDETPVTMEEWHKQRAIQEDLHAGTAKLGFSTFFLNRTNVSGIIKGGVIGGKNQTGTYKLDARFSKNDLISRIERISSYGNRIRLYNQDAALFIRDTIPQFPEKTLVYLDPPYYKKGAELYENHYSHCDHEQIAGLVTSSIRQKWIVSYDDVPEIRNMYAGFRQESFSLSYSAARRYKGAEVLIVGPGLTIPQDIQTSRSAVA